jgi:hypothetical protein
MRGLLLETPAECVAREAKEQADATKAENAKTAKEEKAKKRKADALETKNAKKAKVAAAKAESRSASSSTKAKPKPKAKAKAKAKAEDNQSTLSFPNAPVALDEFADGLTELFEDNEAEAGQDAVTKEPEPKRQCSEGEDANAASEPTVANDGEIAGAVVKESVSNGEGLAEERVSPDGSGSEYSDDEEGLRASIDDSEKVQEQLKTTMCDPDATEVQKRDATRLYAREQKNIDHWNAKLVTMAEAVPESVEPESKRQRLGEDEDSPNEAPPGGLQVAEESGSKLKTTELAKDGAASDDDCNSSDSDEDEDEEDDPTLLRQSIVDAEKAKLSTMTMLADPTFSQTEREQLKYQYACAVKCISDCERRLSRLCPMAV